MDHPTPTGYGRLICDDKQNLIKITEEKDTSPEEKKITLCNSGVIFANTEYLFELLAALSDDNAQNEYYLTDCFEISKNRGDPAKVFITDDYETFAGINNRQQLAEVESFMVTKKIQKLMTNGVGFHLPLTTYIEDDVEIGEDTVIGANCSLLSGTRIGKSCVIDHGLVLKDISIPDSSHVSHERRTNHS